MLTLDWIALTGLTRFEKSINCSQLTCFEKLINCSQNSTTYINDDISTFFMEISKEKAHNWIKRKSRKTCDC